MDNVQNNGQCIIIVSSLCAITVEFTLQIAFHVLKHKSSSSYHI